MGREKQPFTFVNKYIGLAVFGFTVARAENPNSQSFPEMLQSNFWLSRVLYNLEVPWSSSKLVWMAGEHRTWDPRRAGLPATGQLGLLSNTQESVKAQTNPYLISVRCFLCHNWCASVVLPNCLISAKHQTWTSLFRQCCWWSVGLLMSLWQAKCVQQSVIYCL